MSKLIRILMVGDLHQPIATAREAVLQAGYEAEFFFTHTAEDLMAALAQPWDLILTADQLMGLETSTAMAVLEANRHQVPVIVLAKQSGPEFVAACLCKGATDVLEEGTLFRLAPLIARELQVFSKVAGSVPAKNQEIEDWYRLSAASVKDYGIYLVDPGGRIASWNPGAERIKGYRAEEIIGQHISIFYPPEEQPQEKVEKLLTQARAEGRAEELGWQVRKDGSRFWGDMVITALRNEAGALLGYSKITRDLNVQHDFESALQQSYRELTDIKHALDVSTIVAVTDCRGTITYVNEAFCNISRYSTQELIGQNHRIINSGTHPKEFFIEMWRTIAQGRRWQGEIRNRAKDGSLYWVDTTIVPFLDERGKPYQYIAIRHDITRRKALEEELGQAKELAESMSQRKSQFLANMSHELRTPLNAIIGYSEMMEGGMAGALTEKQQKYIHNIVISGRHLLNMVNEILDLSKVEAGKIELTLQPVHLPSMLEELQTVFRALAEKRQIRMVFDIQADISTIDADPVRLKQIFLNLISNAIKFNQPGGQVFVRVRSSEDREWVECQIVDEGIGIPQEKLPELFQEFHQLDNSYARQHEGTGLGLVLTKRLVELHQGTIAVQSLDGSGSTFTFRLPARILVASLSKAL
jgi:PAS domain S-box-containing protein